MHGNVWEWCEDWYGKYAKEAETDPKGASKGSLRVLRGGSWKDGANDARASFRMAVKPSLHYKDTGFRVAARLR